MLWTKTCQPLKVARGWGRPFPRAWAWWGKTDQGLFAGSRIRAPFSGIRVVGGCRSPLSGLAHPTFPSLFLLGDDTRGMQLSPGVGSPPGPPGDLEDDEGLKHLQQVGGGERC